MRDNYSRALSYAKRVTDTMTSANGFSERVGRGPRTGDVPAATFCNFYGHVRLSAVNSVEASNICGINKTIIDNTMKMISCEKS